MTTTQIAFTHSLADAQGDEFLVIDSNIEAFAFMSAAGVNVLTALPLGPAKTGTRTIRFRHEGRECLGAAHWGGDSEQENGFQVFAAPEGVPSEIADTLFGLAK